MASTFGPPGRRVSSALGTTTRSCTKASPLGKGTSRGGPLTRPARWTSLRAAGGSCRGSPRGCGRRRVMAEQPAGIRLGGHLRPGPCGRRDGCDSPVDGGRAPARNRIHCAGTCAADMRA